jgi:hypothetical protein
MSKLTHMVGLIGASFNFAKFWHEHLLLQSTSGAVIIGIVGSGAYVTALLLGFLGDGALQQLRPRFETIRGTPPKTAYSYAKLGLFTLFGGLIALVFQLAAGGVFAPVQALVLGATWPTVISQVLAKTGETDADKIVDLANRIAGKTSSS